MLRIVSRTNKYLMFNNNSIILGIQSKNLNTNLTLRLDDLRKPDNIKL